MAGPVTHIIFTLIAMKLGIVANHDSAFPGAVFPDIRYITKEVTRQETHNNKATLDSIRSKTSAFAQSMDLHAWFDIARERYLTDHGMYTDLPESPYRSHAVKLYEDYLLYHACDNWDNVINSFETIVPEELSLNVSRQTIEKWHYIMQFYFSDRPSIELVDLLSEIKMIPEKAVEEIKSLWKVLEQDSKYKEIILNFYQDFPKMLTAI